MKRYFKIAMSFVLVVVLATALFAQAEAAPIASFDMDDLTDGKIVNSANNKGYVVEGTSPTLVDGKNGKALYFNGTDNYVNLDTDYQFNNYTVAFWAKMDEGLEAIGNRGIITRACNGVALDTWTTEVGQTGGLNHQFADSTDGATNNNWLGHNYNDATIITPGTWTHVAYVWDASEKVLKAYINGEKTLEQVYATSDLQAASTPIIIGGFVRAETGFEIPYQGALDEIKIYDVALSAADVAALMETASDDDASDDNASDDDTSDNPNTGVADYAALFALAGGVAALTAAISRKKR